MNSTPVEQWAAKVAETTKALDTKVLVLAVVNQQGEVVWADCHVTDGDLTLTADEFIQRLTIPATHALLAHYRR